MTRPDSLLWPGTFALGLTLAIACIPPGSKSPTMDQAAAGVVFAARVVHTADAACADAAADLRTSGKVREAADLSGECSTILRDSVDALELATDAITSGRAVEAKQVACAIGLGVRAVERIRPILFRHNVTLGGQADNFLTYGGTFLSMALDAGCKL